jgi:uncharacterized protein YjbI with pentapeptide repeats
VGFYRDAIRRFVPSETAREPLCRRLDAFFLTRLLGHGEQGRLLRWLDGGIAVVTVVVMPLALMLAFQLKYLAFHDVDATDWHRGWLLADVLLLAIPLLWRLFGRSRESNGLLNGKCRGLRGWSVVIGKTLGLTLASGGCVAFSLAIATFPNDRMDWALSAVGLSGKSHPLSSWRVLAPHDTDFVNDEKLDKMQWTVDLRGRDLRGAQLSGADLRKARITKVDLREANMSESQFQGANMSESKFQGANMNKSYFQGADMSESHFQGASIVMSSFQEANVNQSEFQGADVSYSHFEGAYAFLSQFQGANLGNTIFKGADISLSLLQGSSAISSQFQGANLIRTQLKGSDLRESQFKGADLMRANLWAAVVDSNTSFLHADHREQVSYTRNDEMNDNSFIDEWIAAVPAGAARDRMIKRMAILRAEREPDEDAKRERALRDVLGAPPPSLRNDLTHYLEQLVCQEVGEAVHGVTERMSGLSTLWSNASFDHIALAKRILNPNCLGEKHLTDHERAALRRIIRDSKSTPSP